MALSRKHTWVQDLDAYLRANRETPFAYGAFDCCLFVASAIEAMTGVDLAASYRGKYAKPGEALNGVSLQAFVDAAAAAHGITERRSVLFAQRGDMLLVRNTDGTDSLGLLGLDGKRVCHAAAMGWQAIDQAEMPILKAWAI